MTALSRNLKVPQGKQKHRYFKIYPIGKSNECGKWVVQLWGPVSQCFDAISGIELSEEAGMEPPTAVLWDGSLKRCPLQSPFSCTQAILWFSALCYLLLVFAATQN